MPDRVLIIDDEANIRQMLRLTLEAAGYEVGEAGDGIEAFAILGSDNDWNVVLLDQRMPQMEGIQVLRRIKVLAPSARVVMMTAYASVELAVEAMKLGATDFLRKPTTPETVRNAVAAAVASGKQLASGRISPNQASSVTLNGFAILHSPEARVALTSRFNERRFLVRKPSGREQEVVVEISDEALRAAQQAAHGQLVDSAFWTNQAETFLNDFIWNDGDVPANGRLILKGIESEVLARLSTQNTRAC